MTIKEKQSNFYRKIKRVMILSVCAEFGHFQDKTSNHCILSKATNALTNQRFSCIKCNRGRVICVDHSFFSGQHK